MQTGRFLRELTRSCESVWRVAFKEDRAVVLCQRAGGTALEIISFRPEDEKPAGGGRGSSDDGTGAVRGLQA
jgi:F-box and WD-40 domain protein CDC4